MLRIDGNGPLARQGIQRLLNIMGKMGLVLCQHIALLAKVILQPPRGKLGIQGKVFGSSGFANPKTGHEVLSAHLACEKCQKL